MNNFDKCNSELSVGKSATTVESYALKEGIYRFHLNEYFLNPRKEFLGSYRHSSKLNHLNRIRGSELK